MVCLVLVLVCLVLAFGLCGSSVLFLCLVCLTLVFGVFGSTSVWCVWF